jgi:hypothetical protein
MSYLQNPASVDRIIYVVISRLNKNWRERPPQRIYTLLLTLANDLPNQLVGDPPLPTDEDDAALGDLGLQPLETLPEGFLGDTIH